MRVPETVRLRGRRVRLRSTRSLSRSRGARRLVASLLAVTLGFTVIALARALVVAPERQAIGCTSEPPASDSQGVGDGCIDDFDGPVGSSPDPALWTAAEGGGGWGNQELQEYRDTSVYLDGKSHLILEARRETTPDGVERWTSGRTSTEGKASFTTGTLSARIQLPDGQGLLPAFWLLGDSVVDLGWPDSGEIDVVETPNDTGVSFSHVHGPLTASSKSSSTGSSRPLASVAASVNHDEQLSAGFHVYSVARSPGRIEVSIDGTAVLKVSRDSAPAEMEWVFDEPFHLLFSLAVGGNWPGDPDESTPAVSRMVVDWIRYEPLPAASE